MESDYQTSGEPSKESGKQHLSQIRHSHVVSYPAGHLIRIYLVCNENLPELRHVVLVHSRVVSRRPW
jgi:hypothetical protein